MKIYNTLSRKKEEFSPRDGKNIQMYACGITVSGDAHIGHAYQALIYDIIRKYFEKTGYTVNYARNYTDVDDKIIAKSNELGVDAMVYAGQMIAKIDDLMRRFEVDDPNIWLKATSSMDNIIAFVEKLIEKGHAYATDKGDVYFAVESFADYGKLSHRKIEDAYESVRIENEDNKKSPLDFALWKSAKTGEISWKSPWGQGRPGWHIECSAMNMQAFGEQIDIHGGGRDLIFPHHENEIAQTEALTGKEFAKYWIHNGLIKVNGQKMSKSLGNSLLLADLLDQYLPETIKYALLQTNYRGDINITNTYFDDSERQLAQFYAVLADVEKSGMTANGEKTEVADKFKSAMDDDFNTAKALSDLFGYFKSIKKLLAQGDTMAVQMADDIKENYALLGLFARQPQEFLNFVSAKQSTGIPAEIVSLSDQRTQAKKDRNFALADELRAQITSLGYAVKDTAQGVEITKL